MLCLLICFLSTDFRNNALVKEVSGNSNWYWNEIAKWTWKWNGNGNAMDWQGQIIGNGIGNGKSRWNKNMENGRCENWNEMEKWKMENLQAMLYYSVYTLWIWMYPLLVMVICGWVIMQDGQMIIEFWGDTILTHEMKYYTQVTLKRFTLILYWHE